MWEILGFPACLPSDLPPVQMSRCLEFREISWETYVGPRVKNPKNRVFIRSCLGRIATVKHLYEMLGGFLKAMQHYKHSLSFSQNTMYSPWMNSFKDIFLVQPELAKVYTFFKFFPAFLRIYFGYLINIFQLFNKNFKQQMSSIKRSPVTSHFVAIVTLCNACHSLSHFVISFTLCNKFLSHFVTTVILCNTCHAL